MKSKNQVKLVSTLLLAPVVSNANEVLAYKIIEDSLAGNYAVIYPNEKVILQNQNAELSITHKMIIDQIKKQIQIDDDTPLEIFIHEENTNIDINLGDISVTVSIEKASKHIPNVITRTTNDTELSL